MSELPTRQVFCLCGHDQHHHARSKGRCLQCECVKVNPLLTRDEAANDPKVIGLIPSGILEQELESRGWLAAHGR